VIQYRAGYEYQLAASYEVGIEIRPPMSIRTEHVALEPDGLLTIRAGYAWDGPSGPAIDTKNFMRGSLVHDALYQLMREGHLGQDLREAADRILQRICREDGMSALRAWWVYQGVRFGGGPSADPLSVNPILVAP
jgi:hypothetical protein